MPHHGHAWMAAQRLRNCVARNGFAVASTAMAGHGAHIVDADCPCGRNAGGRRNGNAIVIAHPADEILAGAQVVADQIAVVPPRSEKDAKTVNSDLDEGIEKNVDAALIQNSLRKGVQYAVKSGVVTLTGEVNSQSKRAQVEQLVSTVPNVLQVVNELQVKDQKATSTQ